MKSSQNFFSEDKDRGFEAKVCVEHGSRVLVSLMPISPWQMMDDSVRLLMFQQELEKEAPTVGPFTGLSVNETIKSCIVNGLSKKADKVKADWKVPDKRCVHPSLLQWLFMSPCALLHS